MPIAPMEPDPTRGASPPPARPYSPDLPSMPTIRVRFAAAVLLAPLITLALPALIVAVS
jgi:hypothetical protein